MNSFTDKQKQIIKNLNTIADLILEEKNWIEIAHVYCDYFNDDDSIFKLNLIVKNIVDKNSKLNNFVDDFLCNLNSML